LDLLSALQLYWSREFNDAHADFTDIILKYPANSLVLLYSAYCEMQIGNVDVAIGKANEAIQLGHKVAELYLLHAKCYEQIFKPELARAYADSALILSQSNIDALIIIGRSFFFRGEFDESVDILKKISQAQEDNAQCLSLQAMIKSAEYKYSEACELFNRALSISRSDVEIYLLVYSVQRHSEKALEAIRKAIEVAPTDGRPYFYLGNHFCIDKELDSAITAFKTAIRLSPNIFNAYLNLGLLLYEEKQYEEAIEYLQKAKEIYPDNEILLRNMGTCYAQLEKYDEAIAEFKNALAANPKSRITNYNTGLAYMDIKDYDRAKEHFDKAYELGYRHSNLYFQQGKLLLALGDTVEAKKYYEKLRSISTATATKLHNLIIGRDDYVIDSTLDLKMKKLYENITPSLVNAECIGFRLGRPVFYDMVSLLSG
jgi:tetratricopeptide (TPR) repeat protein